MIVTADDKCYGAQRMKKGKKQTGNLPLFLAAFGLVLLLLMGILGEWGLIDFLQLRQEMVDINVANAEIAAENQVLARKIYRLKNDRQYIENIVRKELGVVGDGELIIKMPPVGHQTGNSQKPK